MKTKANTTSEEPNKASSRLLSLDAFRGLAVIVMLLVNTFAGVRGTPTQFRHATWAEPIHLADLAFPWFLFCVGIAIPFSASSFKKKHLPSWKYDLKVFRRTLILLALGALLETTGDVDTSGILHSLMTGLHNVEFFSVGVLQTIAIAYAVSALLYDLNIHRRIAIASVTLIVYWAALKYVPIPGVGAGVFKEDENLILHLNRYYLGSVGLWNVTRLVPTTALVLIGTAIGDMLRQRTMSGARKSAWLIISGIVLMALGYIWSLSLPFNKPVWTPSYILLSAGTGAFVLGVLTALMDVLEWKRWGFPLLVFGANAIVAYVAPIVVKTTILSPLGIYILGWKAVLPFVLFWWIVLWLLYRKKWFIRV